jgi:hypothetical protein
MKMHRTFAAVGAALVALSVTACGDDGDDASADSTLPADTVAPVGSTSPPSGFEHPTGADDVVIRIAYEGGLVPPDFAFRNLPTVLVSGDGHVFQPGPVPEIYPGPLVPPVTVRTVTEQGIQQLLALADRHGLLADADYTTLTNIADAPDTVVEIAADGGAYRHQAYALGIGDETDPARAALWQFVSEVTGDWLFAGNPELSADEPYEPGTFLVRASVAPEESGEIAPTIVDWPAEASVRLADASECAEIPAADVGDLFADANELTYFTDGAITYQLAVKPLLPGDSC